MKKPSTAKVRAFLEFRKAVDEPGNSFIGNPVLGGKPVTELPPENYPIVRPRLPHRACAAFRAFSWRCPSVTCFSSPLTRHQTERWYCSERRKPVCRARSKAGTSVE